MFPIKNGLKQDVLSSLIFNFVLEYATRKVQENQAGLKWTGTHRLLVYADDVYWGITDSTKENTEGLTDASKVGQEVNRKNEVHVDVSSPECRAKS
jgi:hypothetical protein